MKRLIYLPIALLIAVLCIFYVNSTEKDDELEEKYLSDSQAITEKYSGVYLASDGNIISLYSYHGKEEFLQKLNSVIALGNASEVPVFLAIPPRKMDALTDSLPDGFSTEPAMRLFGIAQKMCEENPVTYIDLLSTLVGKSQGTGDLYFATDHHWTSHGAYLAYRSIITALGEKPLEESSFRIESAHTSYRGSDYNKTDKDPKYTRYDTIELYYSENYPFLETTLVNYPYDSDENNIVLEGMYDSESLQSWDPYTVYFKGNTPYITVRHKIEKRETLLIIRDSFASALTPFLAEHFDIVLIDTRFFPDRISTVVEREGASKILILENMGSFTENTVKILY